jgi:hypothetical protein
MLLPSIKAWIEESVSTPPKVLYKYCDARGIDILLHRRLKVTPFNQFNDPFELAPRMRPDLSVEDAHRGIADLDFQRKLYEVTVTESGYNGSFEQFQQLVSLVHEGLAAKLVEEYPDSAARFRLTHAETMSREFGLICLSEVPEDILMWSHYTKGHTGLLIGFDTANQFFAESPLQQVEYKRERVLIGHYIDPRDPPISEIVKALIKTKSHDWSYEKEWRQMHFLARCLSQPDSTKPDRHIYYKATSPSTVCEVITGCRCNVAGISEILSLPEFRHVKWRRARVHDADFKLVFEDASTEPNT